ncbi:hypothetical protein P43SY_003206 [Pythium insidiosum]|uniref:Transmembrane protein n=1 Tax=Pythium insidiosum TaxID=114742 RepID=A0AAD5Q3M8_PYTIN|nr:hypothetical protein P43SY_003206 [Pythium insidiosum]
MENIALALVLPFGAAHAPAGRASTRQQHIRQQRVVEIVIISVLLITQVACAVFLLFFGMVHAYLDRPSMEYYANTLVAAQRRPNFTAWGNVFRALGVLHLVDILHFGWGSLSLQSTVVASGRQLLKEASLRLHRGSTAVKPIDTAADTAVTRWRCCPLPGMQLCRPLQRLFRIFFGRRGLLRVESKHFPTVFVVRELVEAAAQFVQAYKFSLFVTRPWINHVIALSMVVDCWGTPLLTELVVQDPTRRRLAYLVSDAVVTLVTAIVLPTVIFLPWALQLDTQIDAFPATLLYDDKAFMRFVLECRAVLAISTGDCVTKAIGYLGIFYCLRDLFRPWFVKCRPSCVTFEFNCNRYHVLTPNESSFSALNPDALQYLVVSHCPALVVPRIVRSFRWLAGVEFYNSTLLAWPAEAALDVENQRLMGYVGFVRVNMAAFPAALLEPLPSLINDIEFIKTNLTELPEDLNRRWQTMDVVYLLQIQLSRWHPPAKTAKFKFKRKFNSAVSYTVALNVILHFTSDSAANTTPAVLLRLHAFQVSLAGNQITMLPFDKVTGPEQLPLILILSGNPIRVVPDSIASTLWTALLFVERTQIMSPLPTWMTDGSGVTNTLSLWGTPLCDRKDELMPRSVPTIECDGPSVFAFGGYPLDFVSGKRPL